MMNEVKHLNGLRCDFIIHDRLIARRQADLLTSAEQDELISLTDSIEIANVDRIAAVVELAQIRHTTLDTILRTLGLTTPQA